MLRSLGPKNRPAVIPRRCIVWVEALEASRRVLGDEHPETLLLIGNMGNLLYAQRKYDEAMPYCVEALETKRREP